MRKRSGARGAGLVEYALLVVAVMVGAAAAQKAVGPRIASASTGALVALGGAGGPGGDSSNGASNDDGEVGTITALPKVGTGPDATREEMKAADKNGDGVLSTEEQADLRRAQEGGGDRS